jgi:DNA-binding LytR/AlgR family response regulator
VIVIVTAFHEHAIEAFEAGAIDYLLKPVRGERLRKSLERAKGLLGKPREIARTLARIASVKDTPDTVSAGSRKIVGRIGRDYFLLDLDEILALQAEGELVWIVTAERRFLASQTARSRSLSLRASTRSFLLPAFSSAFFRGSHTTTLVTWGTWPAHADSASC